MHFVWVFTVLTLALHLVPATLGQAAQQRAPSEIEILSKADAIRLFGLTKEQWTKNVRDAVAAGAARQNMRGTSSLIGMATTTPENDELIVNLDYSQGESRPPLYPGRCGLQTSPCSPIL